MREQFWSTFKLPLFRIDHPRVIRLLVIVAVCCLDLFLGYKGNQRFILLTFVSIGGLVTFLAFSRSIELGIAVLIPATFIGRFVIGTGTNVPFNLAILLLACLLGIWILDMLVIRKEIGLVPSPVNKPAILFILVTTLALIGGNATWVPMVREQATFFAQLGGWMLYVFSIGLFLMVGNRVKSLIWLGRFTWLFLFFGGIYIAARLVPVLSPLISQVFTRPGWFENPFGSVFWIWLAAFSFSQALLNTDLPRDRRILLGLLFVATLYVGWFQSREWISGWLPPWIALGVIVWLTSWRWGLALTLVAAPLIALRFSFFSSAVMDPTQQYSLFSRTATWPILFELIKANPILGLGMSNYYHYTPLYSLLGWYVKFNSHNNYIDIIAQTGLLGLATFAWLVFEIARLGWGLRKKVQDPFSKAYVRAALGGLVATLFSGLLGDWFLPFLYNIGVSGFRFSLYVWLFLGGLLVLHRIYNRPEIGIEGMGNQRNI